MTKDFYETVLISGGLAGQNFDIAVGPADTEVIDVLLSVGNGTLRIDAPITMRSTGALGAPRTLFLSGVEQPGRIMFIDFSNSDIETNNVAITPTTSINGAASITVSEVSQWIFFHMTGGIWFALRQWPQNTVEGAAVSRLTFASGTWAAGTANQITITRTAGPGAGEIGPTGLDLADTYVVQVYDTDGADAELVDIDVEIDPVTGDIVMFIAGPGKAFGGSVIIIGDL